LYVHNLEERVKLDVLKDTLGHVFSDYGTILDIVAKNTYKDKGQAFVVFERSEGAQAAVVDVDGFEIFGKPMKVEIARTVSDATVQQMCDSDAYQRHRSTRLADKMNRIMREPSEVSGQGLKTGDPIAGQIQSADNGPSKPHRGSALKSSAPGSAAVLVPDEYLPPNKILFVQNFPDDYNAETLTSIFERFDGFREVRMVPGRKGIAFVEYESEQGAITAKENTAGMSFGRSHIIKVTYQRQ
jgi:RNA recognition motif-containing protein